MAHLFVYYFHKLKNPIKQYFSDQIFELLSLLNLFSFILIYKCLNFLIETRICDYSNSKIYPFKVRVLTSLPNRNARFSKVRVQTVLLKKPDVVFSSFHERLIWTIRKICGKTKRLNETIHLTRPKNRTGISFKVLILFIFCFRNLCNTNKALILFIPCSLLALKKPDMFMTIYLKFLIFVNYEKYIIYSI